MRIRHPISFFLMIVVMVATSALSVAWSFSHIIALMVVLALVVALRFAAFEEGKHALAPGHRWFRWRG